MKGRIYVGMSGWTFPPWRGIFYPQGLVQKKELEFASRQVTSIEINGTFYSLQRPSTFQSWYDQTPDSFKFAVKAPRFITHVRRLKEVREPLCNFFASGILCLKRKLGPILWQFPPNLTLKDDRFEKFASILPRNSHEASKLAKNHSSRLEGRAFTHPTENFSIQHAFEFRHESFRDASFVQMLKKYRIALVVGDSSKKYPYFEDLTSDFVYVRMHGEHGRYQSSDLVKKLEKFRVWAGGKQIPNALSISSEAIYPGKKDVFVYFANDDKLCSPLDAQRLIKLLKKM